MLCSLKLSVIKKFIFFVAVWLRRCSTLKILKKLFIDCLRNQGCISLCTSSHIPLSWLTLLQKGSNWYKKCDQNNEGLKGKRDF